MARPKIKGAGGIGQWDLQTATQDIRAATPKQSRSGRANTGGGLNPYSGPGMSTPLGPGSPGYVPVRTGRKTGRGRRKTGRGGRGSGRR